MLKRPEYIRFSDNKPGYSQEKGYKISKIAEKLSQHGFIKKKHFQLVENSIKDSLEDRIRLLVEYLANPTTKLTKESWKKYIPMGVKDFWLGVIVKRKNKSPITTKLFKHMRGLF